jgi:hypothetical protein
MDFQKIKLLGGAEVTVDFDEKLARCKSCGSQIRFAVTANNKLMPIIQKEDGQWQSHFTDCAAAADFRKTKTERRIESENYNQNLLGQL